MSPSFTTQLKSDTRVWPGRQCSANSDEQASDPHTYRMIISDPVALAAVGYAVLPCGADGRMLVKSAFEAARDPVSARRLFSRHNYYAIGVVDFSVRGKAAVWPTINLRQLRSKPCWWGTDGRIAGDLDLLATLGAVIPAKWLT